MKAQDIMVSENTFNKIISILPDIKYQSASSHIVRQWTGRSIKGWKNNDLPFQVTLSIYDICDLIDKKVIEIDHTVERKIDRCYDMDKNYENTKLGVREIKYIRIGMPLIAILDYTDKRNRRKIGFVFDNFAEICNYKR